MEFLNGLDVEEKQRSKAEVDRALALGDEVEQAKALGFGRDGSR
jgi:hypothetical protein